MNKQSSDLTVEVGNDIGAGVEGEKKMEKSVPPIELWKFQERAGMLGSIYELIARDVSGLYSWHDVCEASKSQSFSLDDWLLASVQEVLKSIDDDPMRLKDLVTGYQKQRWTQTVLNEDGKEKMEKSVAPIELWKLQERAGMLGSIYELIARDVSGLYSWHDVCEASKSQGFSMDDWLHATVLDISKSIDDDPKGMEGLVAYSMKQQRWTHDALSEYGKLTLVEGDDGCSYMAYSDYNHKDLFILDWIQNAEELFEIIHQYPHEGAMICQEAREKLKILQDGAGSNSTESS
jgi:hypothetical protein